MKLNLPLIKLIIRLLILLILFVMLFIISAFLYSAKFWPDVYNYINANITIKRIPTISELNPVFVEEVDFTTEMYSTTDNIDYQSTVDDYPGLSFDDFLNDAVENKRRKRQIPIEEMKIRFEIKKAIYDDTFDFEVTTKGFVGDLVDEDKLTKTNSKDVEMIFKADDCIKGDDGETKDGGEVEKQNETVNATNGIYSVFPWIAAVFVKNNENNQFDYICDGGVLSDNVVLTAARCILKENVTVDVENMLVILGKRSLQENGPNEKVLRVKAVKLHENFTADEGKVDNDLAIIVLAEPVAFNNDIHPVPLKDDSEIEAIETATTGWHVTGRLTPIYFDKEASKTRKKNTDALSTFCAVFGDDITTCPSYGGLFVARHNDTEWSLQGLTTGSPTNRGACFSKNVTFTNISHYYQWIMRNIELNKV